MVIEPVIKSVRVDLPIEEAFDLFTDGMSEWWPLHTHSLSADTFEGRVAAERVTFEQHEGGRIYETLSDGREYMWGSVLEWDRPARVVFSWKPNLTDGPSTEIEVRFATAADGTKVVLEHRGWERLGEVASEHRKGYVSGWAGILELYRSVAGNR